LTNCSQGGAELKKTKKKTVIGKIAAIIMIASICSLTVAIPSFADYGNTGVYDTYDNYVGCSSLIIENTAPQRTDYNGVYSLDYVIPVTSGVQNRDYSDPITSGGSANPVSLPSARRNISNVQEGLAQSLTYFKPYLGGLTLPKQTINFTPINLRVLNPSDSNRLSLFRFAFQGSLSTADVAYFNTNTTAKISLYNRRDNEVITEQLSEVDFEYISTEIEQFDGNRTTITYYLNYGNIATYNGYISIPNLEITVPQYSALNCLEASYQAYGYNNGYQFGSGASVRFVGYDELPRIYKITVYNDVVNGFANVGDFLDESLQSIIEAEFFPGLAIGGILTLILLFGLLGFTLKLIIGGL
jgi:hypothetical protein